MHLSVNVCPQLVVIDHLLFLFVATWSRRFFCRRHYRLSMISSLNETNHRFLDSSRLIWHFSNLFSLHGSFRCEQSRQQSLPANVASDSTQWQQQRRRNSAEHQSAPSTKSQRLELCRTFRTRCFRSDHRRSLVHSFSCRCLLQSTGQHAYDGSLLAGAGRQNSGTWEYKQEAILERWLQVTRTSSAHISSTIDRLSAGRNFLDEISYEIVDWLRDEEAKYQAEQLAQEVQVYVRQASPQPEPAKGAATDGAAKKGKGATGKSESKRRSSARSDKSFLRFRNTTRALVQCQFRQRQ